MFSAPIYIRGSVKNYATRLKLDVPTSHGRARRRTGRDGKIQRAAAVQRVTKTPMDEVMFWLAKMNMKMALVGAAPFGVLLIIVLAHAVLKHGEQTDSSVKVPPRRYEPGQCRRHAAAAHTKVNFPRRRDTARGCATNKSAPKPP